MDIGLLWFDDDKEKALEKKVIEAVTAYCQKPHFAEKSPDTCYVHPTMLPGGERVQLNGVRVLPTSTIAPHYLFVGAEMDGEERCT